MHLLSPFFSLWFSSVEIMCITHFPISYFIFHTSHPLWFCYHLTFLKNLIAITHITCGWVQCIQKGVFKFCCFVLFPSPPLSLSLLAYRNIWHSGLSALKIRVIVWKRCCCTDSNNIIFFKTIQSGYFLTHTHGLPFCSVWRDLCNPQLYVLCNLR